MPKLIKDIIKKAVKRDTVNLAKALTSPKALAAQKNAAAVRPRPMGLKTDSSSNMVKALTSPKAKAMRDSTLKAYVAKTGKMPMGLKVDSTKKVTPNGKSKPSIIIKKPTTVKPAKPVEKLMPYKPAKKEIIKKISEFSSRKDMVPINKISGQLKKRIDNFNKSKKVVK